MSTPAHALIVSDLSISSAELGTHGVLTIRATALNDGAAPVEGRVELHARRDWPADAPTARLADADLTLSPGHECRLTFAVHAEHLGVLDPAGRGRVQAGRVRFLVGTSADHLPVSAAVDVMGPDLEVSTVPPVEVTVPAPEMAFHA